MADFKAKRRTEAQIRKAWEADAPIKTAELAVIMQMNRTTMQRWVQKGLPRFGTLVRKSSFDKWWNRQARKDARTRTKPEEKKAPKKEAAPPVIVCEPPKHYLPPKAAMLLVTAEISNMSGKAGELFMRASR